MPLHITSHERERGEYEYIGAEKSIEIPKVFYIDSERYLSMMRQFHLGQHKVQQLKGSKTFVLPVHWCKNNGIQAGDAISMILNAEGDLVLKAPGK
ncbi:MAG: hypothetical protein WC343_13560 [Bacilli bacterium]